MESQSIFHNFLIVYFLLFSATNKECGFDEKGFAALGTRITLMSLILMLVDLADKKYTCAFAGSVFKVNFCHEIVVLDN